MPKARDMRMDLIKFASGDRLLRIGEVGSGLCLEKKLDCGQPIVKEKEKLLKVFEVALAVH